MNSPGMPAVWHMVVEVSSLVSGQKARGWPCQHARYATECGATALMAIPPVSIVVGEQELRGYFEGILNATSLPVIVQDASGYLGWPMSIHFQADLLDECGPERVLFKPEATPIGPRLTELRDGTQGRARIFEETGGIALVDFF